MTTKDQGHVIFHGPIATHDVTCPIYGCPNPAVLDFGSPGIFQPCWSCQDSGFHTVRQPPRRWWQFWRR